MYAGKRTYKPNSERTPEELERLRAERRQYQQAFRASHPGYDAAKAAAWRAANPKKEAANQRRAYLKRRYGLTDAQYAAEVAAQGGRCAICQNGQKTRKSEYLFVDHNHATGERRALLCNDCNLLIGNARENVDILHLAVKYLEKHNVLAA